MIKALIWSEWRRQRWAVAVLAIVTVGLWSTTMVLEYFNTPGLECVVIPVFLFFPAISGYTLTSDVFAGEFSHKTTPFLWGLPVRSSKVYWCKYLYTLATVLLANTVNSGLAYLVPKISKRFFHGHESRLVYLIIILTVLIHIIVFFASLVKQRANGGIVAIILLPLALLGLIPAAVLPGLWFNSSPWSILGSAYILAAVLWLLLLLFGWYLWSKRLAVGLSIFKPIIIAGTLTLTLSWSLYGIAYAYAAYDLTRAEQEASAAGLNMDMDKLAPPPLNVPASQNAATLLLPFLKKWQQFTDKNHYSITAQDFQRLEEDLQRILYRPAFIPEKNNSRHISEYLYGPYEISLLNNLKKVTFYQAKAAVALGREQDFFQLLEHFPLLAGFYLQVPYLCNRNDASATLLTGFRLAVTDGPVTPSALPYYRKMLTEIDRALTSGHNHINRCRIELELMSQPLPLALAWLFRPRYLKGAAEATRLDIEEDKLLQVAKTKRTMNEVSVSHERIRRKRRGLFIPVYGVDRIFDWFHIRSRIEFIRLALELKIYRIEHGAFPEKLSRLKVTIPDSPWNGKPFEYRREGDGFTIFSGSKGSLPLVSYQPLPATQHSEVKK